LRVKGKEMEMEKQYKVSKREPRIVIRLWDANKIYRGKQSRPSWVGVRMDKGFEFFKTIKYENGDYNYKSGKGNKVKVYYITLDELKKYAGREITITEHDERETYSIDEIIKEIEAVDYTIVASA